MLRISGIVEESIVDGPGVRIAIFFQGCAHHCKGCQNQQTWSEEGGYLIQRSEIIQKLKKNPILSGITLTGGDPVYQAYEAMKIAEETKKLGKSVWMYTGFLYEDLLMLEDPVIQKLLKLCDIVVDGEYIQSMRSLNLLWRGSSNQRLWNRGKEVTALYDRDWKRNSNFD